MDLRLGAHGGVKVEQGGVIFVSKLWEVSICGLGEYKVFSKYGSRV